MRVQLHPCYVLHLRAYRETSVIVEALARDLGRVGLVARGAKRRGSRLHGVLRSFAPLLLSWSGRGELGTLTDAEPAGIAPPLDRDGLYSGFYANELLMRLLHRDDPHPGLYAHYEQALAGLGAGAGLEAVLRIFEKRLLESVGYGALLDHDAGDGQPVRPERRYRYLSGVGPLAGEGPDGAPVSGRVLLALEAEDVAGLAALGPDERREAKRLTRLLLEPHLGDRPLKSRELFAAARRG